MVYEDKGVIEKMTKMDIRKKMLHVRNGIDKQIRKKKNHRITSAIINFLKGENIKSILFYASFGSEVDTWQIFEYCLEKTMIRTAFPKVNKFSNCLDLYWVNRIDDLKEGFRKILEPVSDKKAFLDDIEIILVPAVAFDKNCFRIGYGGGFYDRLLKHKKGLAVGLAYEEQIVDALPVEIHDKKVDLIVTDERIINCV